MAMNWRRRLSHPLKDKHGRELRTLHDARAHVLALGDAAERPQWRHAGALMLAAAKGRGIKAIDRRRLPLSREWIGVWRNPDHIDVWFEQCVEHRNSG